MATALSAAKGKLDAILSAQTRFAAGLTAGTPGVSVDSNLQQFQNQQTVLLQGLPSQLQTQLDAADWAALQAFLSKELVAKLHVGIINNARSK